MTDIVSLEFDGPVDDMTSKQKVMGEFEKRQGPPHPYDAEQDTLVDDVELVSWHQTSADETWGAVHVHIGNDSFSADQLTYIEHTVSKAMKFSLMPGSPTHQYTMIK